MIYYRLRPLTQHRPIALILLVQDCDPATDTTRIRMKQRWHYTPTPYNDQLRSAGFSYEKSAACTRSTRAITDPTD